MITIGAYEAKTKLPELLNRVAKGEKITITRRGARVAILVPAEEEMGQMSAKEILARFRAFQKTHPLRGQLTRELVRRGRRL